MYGFSTSLAALAFYLVACLSASWMLYSDATDADSNYLYETWVSPYAVCMRVFGKREMAAVNVCKSSLNGGTLTFSSPTLVSFNVPFPFEPDSELTGDDASRLQAILACLIIATFCASLANGEHWEFAMRRLSGYRAYALLSPVSTPLIAEHSGYQSHSHQIDLPASRATDVHVALAVGSEERIMPARVVWTIILANTLSVVFGAIAIFVAIGVYKDSAFVNAANGIAYQPGYSFFFLVAGTALSLISLLWFLIAAVSLCSCKFQVSFFASR